MKEHDQIKFNELIKEYNDHPKVKSMREFIQHGATTTYDHCHRVARLSYLLNRKLHLHANEEEFVPAALLHDFFLYDWHNGPKIPLHKFRFKHGFVHSKIAADNAKEVFGISDKMHSMILSHMWPLNITKVPKSKEALILCVADKCIALKETLARRKEGA